VTADPHVVELNFTGVAVGRRPLVVTPGHTKIRAQAPARIVTRRIKEKESMLDNNDVDRQVLFRRLPAYGAVVVAVAPVLLWHVLVIPAS
jgi:hypothetical protein